MRRFPRDPNRKQRVPFIASPARLQAALDRIEGKLDSDEHVGLRYHRIVVNRENLDDYAEGQEPKGLQVQIVDQREDIVFWTDSDLRPLRTFFPRGLRSATLRASGPALCSHSARALLGFYP